MTRAALAAALAAAALAITSLLVTATNHPSNGVNDPVKIATGYVEQLAKANGIVIERESVQAVRQTGNAAIVLVRLRIHQVVFGITGPSQDLVVRVRLAKSPWSVSTTDVA